MWNIHEYKDQRRIQAEGSVGFQEIRENLKYPLKDIWQELDLVTGVGIIKIINKHSAETDIEMHL